ncbi:hypothetical protein HXX76_012796 [Chlamydomonas incerta]|uniref:F-box domain-containing protein n=1 Tax=Chlamydomonas incerta TaxID=51695 RepID=A0A835SND9_CHLIN|nr:hypothetical protein HXX76_012796 [Chlamydomonas incerta]|eukprot:KAG2426738.1 hypothetical protein HXX76_012796 [Chlamydomonas incerta]
MKLRLRAAGTGALYRLDVEPGNWGNLCSEVRLAVGLADDAPVVLSLNKKTPLEPAGDGDGLDKLGVCGGDLLWLLSPAPETPPPANGSVNGNSNSSCSAAAPPVAAVGAAAASRSGAPVAAAAAAATPAAPAAAAGDGSTRAAAEPMEVQAGADRGGGGGGGGSSSAVAGSGGAVAGTDGGGGAAGSEDGGEEGPLAPLPAEEEEVPDGGGGGAAAAARPHLPGVPAKLRLLLCAPSHGASASASANAGVAAPAPAGPARGPVLFGALLPAPARALLVVDAVMAESGLAPLQDLPALLSSNPAAPLPRQLLYGCSYIQEEEEAAVAAAVAAVASGAAASASGGAGGGDVAMAEAGGGGGGGDGGGGGGAAAVKLVWYTMGRHLVVHGSPIATVHQTKTGQPIATTTTTVNIDLSEYSTAAPPSGGDAAASAAAAAVAAAAAAAGLPAALAAHWRRLKDGLALPLLAAACRAAGVPPPVGLPALPMELQLAVLAKLQARDLVALGATCRHMHGMAYDDCLWRPLYESEFGAAGPQSDQQLAAARGWAHVFGRRWRERVEARRRRQQFRPVAPMWGPPPLAPLARAPFMPPGSIGGDFDRLPAIGGGMILPGGGLPGGLPGGFGFGGIGGRGGGRFGGGGPGGPGGPGGFGVPRPRQWGGGGMGGGWM